MQREKGTHLCQASNTPCGMPPGHHGDCGEPMSNEASDRETAVAEDMRELGS